MELIFVLILIFFEKLNKIMYIKPVIYTYISAADYKDVYIDNSIEDDYIKIFLGKDCPDNITEGWSPSVPIGKVENLLKLKAFI